MLKRVKTNYPGVYYHEAKRIVRGGTEKVYFYTFKKDGKLIWEKAGRQYKDKMGPQNAARIRSERIEGTRLSPKEIRQAREAKENRWTIERLWEEYKDKRPEIWPVNW